MGDAQRHEAGKPSKAKALGLFAVATALAIAGSAAVVGVVLEGEFLTGAAEAIHRHLNEPTHGDG